MKPQTIISADIGYGFTKAYAGPPDQPVRFPSVIGTAEEIQFTGSITGKPTAPAGIQLDNHFIGDLALEQSALPWSTRDRERPIEEIMTLTLAALSELNVSGQISLITGLPVKWFKSQKPVLEDALSGIHTINRAGRRSVKVEIKPLVTVQPFGALFYTIFNSNGKIINSTLARGQVGVIDIGMFTTDLVIFDNGKYIEPGSGSVTTAMSRVYERAAKIIEQKYGRLLSIHQTDLAIRSGSVSVRGKSHPLGDIIDPILSDVANNILAYAATKWETYEAGLDTILVSGGGAAVIGPYLISRFPHLMILPDGGLINVIGYHRYGLYRERYQATQARPSRKQSARQRATRRIKSPNGKVAVPA